MTPNEIPIHPEFKIFYKSIAEKILGEYSGQTTHIVDSMALGFYTRNKEAITTNKSHEYFEGELIDIFNLVYDIRSCLNPVATSTINQSENVIEDYRNKLKKLGFQNPGQVVWPFPSAKFGLAEGENGPNAWQFNSSYLSELSQNYYEKYLGYSNSLENIFISALSYHEAYNYGLAQKDKDFIHQPKSVLSFITANIWEIILIFCQIVLIAITWISLNQIHDWKFSLIGTSILILLFSINGKLKLLTIHIPRSTDFKKSTSLLNMCLDVSEMAASPIVNREVILRHLYHSMESGAVWDKMLFNLAESMSKDFIRNSPAN